MQDTCIIHIAGALLPADQRFELLRQRQPFGLVAGLARLFHLRSQRVDGVAALSRCGLTDERCGHHENNRHDRARALHALIRHKLVWSNRLRKAYHKKGRLFVRRVTLPYRRIPAGR